MTNFKKAKQQFAAILRPLIESGRLVLEEHAGPETGKASLRDDGVYVVGVRKVNASEDSATLLHELYHIAQHQTGKTVPFWSLGVPSPRVVWAAWKHVRTYRPSQWAEEMAAELFSRVYLAARKLQAEEVGEEIF
jgi:hypothetical protein